MKKLLGLLLLLVCCKEVPTAAVVEQTEVPVDAPELIVDQDQIPSLSFEETSKYLNFTDGKTYVINFWATWCAPCVKELPYFEQLGENFKEKEVEVILISLDFPQKVESQLKPFVKKRNLQSKVIHLNDPKQNEWIPKVSVDWSGAIPATLIYNKQHRKFYEKSFTYQELETELKTILP